MTPRSLARGSGGCLLSLGCAKYVSPQKNYSVRHPNSTLEWSRLKVAILRFTSVQSRTLRVYGPNEAADLESVLGSGFW